MSAPTSPAAEIVRILLASRDSARAAEIGLIPAADDRAALAAAITRIHELVNR